MNIAEIEMQLADLVGQPFDQGEFAFQFLEIYNAPKATLTKLRSGTQNKGEKPSDVLWSRKLYFRAVPQGRVAEALDALRGSKATKSQKPRFLLATDGHEVAAYDTKTDDTHHCDYGKLNDRFDFFLPLAGIEKYDAIAENPADIKAAGRLAKLHDEIERHNPAWLVPEKRHALNIFLTRILFCMFAEDNGSFPQDLFVKTISEFGGYDGEYLQELFKQMFDAMNVPDDRRSELPAHIRAFPYVNGGLFADSTDVPAFNRRAKRMLVEAAQLDWREINPDIFGSMIQAVVDTDMRGDLGMHYTSVPNIMKVLQPLFLMSLEEEFERARCHREERSLLRKLLTRVSRIRVFDPACGSGNFLIIAYRELRTLEMRIFQRLDEIGGGQTTWREQSGVKLSNFYGVELADFAAETTKLSLWIAEYQMNQRFRSLFGESPKSFPLRDGGHIVCGNALRLDWNRICPPAKKSVQREKVFDLTRVDTNRKRVTNISAYLTENDDVYVEKLPAPLDGRPELVLGNQAIDGGHLILSSEDHDQLLATNPKIERFIRPLCGNNDFYQSARRFCVWVRDEDYPRANAIPELAERFRKVAEYRRSGGEVARSLVHIPYRFRYVHEAKDSILLIPRYTTERRLYLPVGMLDASVIVTDTVQVTYDPETFWFSILSSKLHVTWMIAVAGRFKTDPRYSNTLVYNNFPVPNLEASQKAALEVHAWSIISTRESYPGKTIDWLYDPDTMPQSLVEAHVALDDTLEKIYIGRPFRSDTERLEHLFELYIASSSQEMSEAVSG